MNTELLADVRDMHMARTSPPANASAVGEEDR